MWSDSDETICLHRRDLVDEFVAVAGEGHPVDFDGLIVGVVRGPGDGQNRGARGELQGGYLVWQWHAGADRLREPSEGVAELLEAGIEAAGTGIRLFDPAAPHEVGWQVGRRELHGPAVGEHAPATQQDPGALVKAEQAGNVGGSLLDEDLDLDVGTSARSRGVGHECAAALGAFGTGEAVASETLQRWALPHGGASAVADHDQALVGENGRRLPNGRTRDVVGGHQLGFTGHRLAGQIVATRDRVAEQVRELPVQRPSTTWIEAHSRSHPQLVVTSTAIPLDTLTTQTHSDINARHNEYDDSGNEAASGRCCDHRPEALIPTPYAEGARPVSDPARDPSPVDWRHRSACRDVDPELFFPAALPGSPAAREQAAAAQAVCGRCPVRVPCLADSLTDPYGVWGGLAEEQRDPLARAHTAYRTGMAALHERARGLAADAAVHAGPDLARLIRTHADALEVEADLTAAYALAVAAGAPAAELAAARTQAAEARRWTRRTARAAGLRDLAARPEARQARTVLVAAAADAARTLRTTSDVPAARSVA